MKSLIEDLQEVVTGDVATDSETLTKMSRDTSIFTRTPSVVIYPKNADDVSRVVRVIREHKEQGEEVSLTARSAGTCMSGGPLTTSVVAVFTKYINHVCSVEESTEGGYAVTEPGVYYRDFEKEIGRASCRERV